MLGLAVVVLAAALVAARLLDGEMTPAVFREQAPVMMAVAPTPPRRIVAVAGLGATAGDALPVVTILVVGLGLAEAATLAAIDLPAAAALAFSPYGDPGSAWRRMARAAGHEVLAEVPVEPADPAAADAGPRRLRPTDTFDSQREVLAWVLEQRPVAPSAIVMAAGSFARYPAALAPILGWLAGKGLDVVALGGPLPAAAGPAERVPHANAVGPIDGDLAPDAIDAALAGLELAARRSGRAIGYARSYPVSLHRIAAWASTLDRKGLRLAPLGQTLERLAAVEPKPDE